ncbi:MAG: FAD-dependent oxidoreductase [Planctomycetaceae bacterium]|jgi:thioredoxin reductase|nr:FAD-dependent oxidoreductase [Planctomycetaceae bacterium]
MKRIILFFSIAFFFEVLFCPCICVGALPSGSKIISATINPRSDLRVPVIAEVDVLVIGGTTGGVAAAVAAAKNGAKTFLVAPYPYLGEDMTATLRLWLEPDETLTDPLAIAIYNDAVQKNQSQPQTNIKQSHNFSYKTEGILNPKHPENEQKTRLADKIINDPTRQSLQFDSGVTTVADMKTPKELSEIDLVAFFRSGDFEVNEVIYSASNDGQNWKILGSTKITDKQKDNDKPLNYPLKLNPPIKTRYIKAEAKRAPEAKRILLSELFLVPSDKNEFSTQELTDCKLPKYPPSRPLHVKKVLDDALLESGVSFVYSSYVTGVLVDKKNQPDKRPRVCGVIISNRQGDQAIIAQTIIDASLTHNFSIAAVPDADGLRSLREYNMANHDKKVAAVCEFVVVGGEPQTFKNQYGLNGTPQVMGTYSGKFPNDAKTSSGTHKLIRYKITQANESQKITNFETKLQMATYHPEQQEYADAIWQESSFDYSKLIPSYETNHRAIIFDNKMRPINLIAQGRKVGKQFAQTAKKSPKIKYSELQLYNEVDSTQVDCIYGYEYPRPLPKTFVDLPMLRLGGARYSCRASSDVIPRRCEGDYDVIVVGGGISGAPAAIAAGRQGAKVLLIEYLHGLGGIGTEGTITNYYFGNRVGFTAEVEGGKAQWVIQQRKQWWRKACVEANVQIEYGTMGIGALVSSDEDNRTVIGVKTVTDDAAQYAFGKVIIDATGNGDVAFAAGLQSMYIDASEIAVQGAGLPPKELGGRYRNTDYTFVDESDIFDSTHLFVYAKSKFPDAFDLSKILGTRERRRIVGDYVLTVLDQINERTYPDTIVRARSNFDTHGYTISPYLEIEHPNYHGFYSYLPYRMYIPKNIGGGILVAGLAASCERDAVPLLRMQPDLQNQGYALGYIAAVAVKDNVNLRKVDIRKVQKHLVQIGNLPASVLNDVDNYEELRVKLPEAVKNLPQSKSFNGAYRIFWYPDEGQKLVRKAFDTATDKNSKLCYAQVLAVMGDPIGIELLIEKVNSYEKWDKGWNFRGMHQFGSALSPLDRLILALGRSGDKRAVPVIVEKLNQLTFSDDFSHYRVCSLALEKLQDPSAAPAIAAALKKPNVTGYVHRSIEIAKKWDKADPKIDTGEKSRRNSLLEIGLARALFRLGDHDGLGKSILTDYAQNDLRGHFRKHAILVLDSAK